MSDRNLFSTSTLVSYVSLLVLTVFGIVRPTLAPTARPADGSASPRDELKDLQDVPLWADPFLQKRDGECHESNSDLGKLSVLKGALPILIGVDTSTRADDLENRIRARQAVNYVMLCNGLRREPTLGLASVDLVDGTNPWYVRVEMYERSDFNHKENAKLIVKRVAIFWVDESHWTESGAIRSAELLVSRVTELIKQDAAAGGNREEVRPVAYLGPSNSDTLGMLTDACHSANIERLQEGGTFCRLGGSVGLQLYLTSTTVDSVRVDASTKIIPAPMPQVGGDQQLMQLMLHEMELRGILSTSEEKSGSPIILITELDTRYGMQWREFFAGPRNSAAPPDTKKTKRKRSLRRLMHCLPRPTGLSQLRRRTEQAPVAGASVS